jgi:hypothetical protein
MLDLNDLHALVDTEAMLELTATSSATATSAATSSTTAPLTSPVPNPNATTPVNPSPVVLANANIANANSPKPTTVATNAASSTASKVIPSLALSDRTFITVVLEALQKKHKEEISKFKLISSQGDEDDVPDLFSNIFDEKVQLMPTAPVVGTCSTL